MLLLSFVEARFGKTKKSPGWSIFKNHQNKFCCIGPYLLPSLIQLATPSCHTSHPPILHPYVDHRSPESESINRNTYLVCNLFLLYIYTVPSCCAMDAQIQQYTTHRESMLQCMQLNALYKVRLVFLNEPFPASFSLFSSF